MPNFLESLAEQARKRKEQLQRGASAVVAQINPADNGRTYRTVMDNRPAPKAPTSAFQQLTHNGVTNVAGDLAKPIVRLPLNVANASGNLGRRAAGLPGQSTQEQFSDPLTARLTKLSGADGSLRQLAGDTANVALTAFAPGSSKVIEQGIVKAAPKVIPKVAARLSGKVVGTGVTGGVVGGPSNVATLVSDKTQPLNRENVTSAFKTGAVTGAVGGAVLPIGGAAAGAAVRKALPAVTKGVKATAQAVDNAGVPKNLRLTQQERYNLSDYADYKAGRYRPSNAAMTNEIIKNAYSVAKKAGIDVTSGSPRDIDGRVGKFLENFDRARATAKQGGFVKVPGTPDSVPPNQNSIVKQTKEVTAETAKQVRDASVEEGVNNTIPDLEAGGAKTLPTAPPTKPPTTRPATTASPDPMMPKPQQQLATQGSGVTSLPPQAIGEAKKGNATRYASKTVPESEFVSEQIRKDVKLGAPDYNPQTERARYTDSLTRLKEQGDDAFGIDVNQRLQAPTGKISSQDVVDAQTYAAKLDINGDPASLEKATQIYTRLSEHLTAAGQTVQAAAILSRRSPEGLRYWAAKQFNEAGVKVTPELQNQINKLAAATKTRGDNKRAVFELTKLVNDNIPSGTGDRIINLWRAGLLTAPTTTLGNITGNLGEAIVRKGFVNPVATAADAALGLFTGRRTQTLAPLGSGLEGGKIGASKLPEFMRTGFDERTAANKYDVKDVNYGNSTAGKAATAYVNGVYRLMSVADQPFYYSAHRNALGSIAKAEAINAGVKGQAYKQFVSEFMANPPEAALERAANEAAYATFANKTGLGKAAVAFKEGLNKVIPGLGDFIVPFTQVPASIATRIVTRTPVGTAAEVVKQMINVRRGGQFDQRAMAQAIGEGAFGTAVLGAGYALANSDLMTFGFPSDKTERALWESEGKQPYSVKVGNRWYSLNYLQPFGTILAVGAKAGEELEAGKSWEQAIGTAVATSGQSIANQSFVKGMSGAIDAITDPEASMTKFVNQTGSSLVPNFIRATARSFDPMQREEKGFIAGIKQGIPGLRDDTNIKIGAFGEELTAKDNPANQLLNPLRPSIDRSGDPVLAEARRLQDAELGALPSQINKATFGKDSPLNDGQVRALQTVVGRSVNDVWGKLIQNEKYQGLSDEDKSKALKRLSSDVLALEKKKFAAANQLGEYSPTYTGKQTKLSSAQSAIANGNFDPSMYARPEGTKNAVTLKDDSRGTALLDKVGILNKDQLAEWEGQNIDPGDKDLYDRAQQIRIPGMPELPQSNKTLKAYADYLEIKAKNSSELKLNNAKKEFLTKAYQSGLSENARELYGNYSINDKYQAVASGQISKQEFEQAVALDDLLVNTGIAGSAKISNRLRRAFGYGDAPKSTTSGGGSGGKKLKPSDFKLPVSDLVRLVNQGNNLAANARL